MTAYEVNPHHTTLRPDQRGRLTLRPYLRRVPQPDTDEFIEYRVHPYKDGAILLRPVVEDGVES